MSDPFFELEDAPGAPWVRAVQLAEAVLIFKQTERGWVLDPVGKAVLRAICRHCGGRDADEAYVAWPSQQLLSRATHFSERAVRDAIVRLERFGFIGVERNGSHGPRGGRKSNCMKINVRALLDQLTKHGSCLPAGLTAKWLRSFIGVEAEDDELDKDTEAAPAGELEARDAVKSPESVNDCRDVESDFPAAPAGELEAAPAGVGGESCLKVTGESCLRRVALKKSCTKGNTLKCPTSSESSSSFFRQRKDEGSSEDRHEDPFDNETEEHLRQLRRQLISQPGTLPDPGGVQTPPWIACNQDKIIDQRPEVTSASS